MIRNDQNSFKEEQRAALEQISPDCQHHGCHFEQEKSFLLLLAYREKMNQFSQFCYLKSLIVMYMLKKTKNIAYCKNTDLIKQITDRKCQYWIVKPLASAGYPLAWL